MVKGWKYESNRHALAAKGIKTAVANKPLDKIPIKETTTNKEFSIKEKSLRKKIEASALKEAFKFKVIKKTFFTKEVAEKNRLKDLRERIGVTKVFKDEDKYHYLKTDRKVPKKFNIKGESKKYFVGYLNIGRIERSFATTDSKFSSRAAAEERLKDAYPYYDFSFVLSPHSKVKQKF